VIADAAWIEKDEIEKAWGSVSKTTLALKWMGQQPHLVEACFDMHRAIREMRKHVGPN